MPNQNSDTSVPQALIINPDCCGAYELEKYLESIGLSIQKTSEFNATNVNFDDYSYIAWYSNNVDKSIEKLQKIDIKKSYFPKTLFIISLENNTENKSYENLEKIQEFGQANKIDLRIICHLGIWGRGEGVDSDFIAKIVNNLRQGNLVLPNNIMIYPLKMDVVIPFIASFWFDRGHMGKSVIIRGKPIDVNQLRSKFVKNYSDLTVGSETDWVIGEGIENSEFAELPSSSDEFVQYLESNIAVSTPRVVKKVLVTKINPIPPRTIINPVVSTPPKSVSRFKVRRTKTFVGIIALCLVVIAIVPFGIYFYSLYQAKNSSSNDAISSLEIKKNNIDGAIHNIEIISSWLKPIPLISNMEKNINKQAYAMQEKLLTLKAENELVTAAKRMITATEGDPFVPLKNAKHSLDDLYVFQSTHDVNNYANRQWVIDARKAADMVPQLIPADKKITVMILLQNNLELRPTGGFIGAVALLTFDHGKLLNTDIRDIYDLDSNLKGLVNPPEELKTYLGESSWFFRDANWSPSFLDVAGTTNWFLEKEWGSTAEVVIAINLNTLKVILGAIGSITLPDGQIIGPDNLMVTAFNHSDVPIAKPDTKKQEFMSLFIKPLLDQVSEKENDHVIKLLKAVGLAANNNELFITSTDGVLLRELVDNGWAGNIVSPKCPTHFGGACQSDFIFLNEANVGINKSNYYLTRTIDHSVSLTDTGSNHTHTVQYKNTSPNDTWPGGSYKSYTRMYVPKNAVNITISINGIPVPSSSVPTLNSSSYQTIGFFLEVKPQATTSLEIKYSVGQQGRFQSYVFAMQKQSGVTSDKFTLSINPSPERVVSRMNVNGHDTQTPSLSGMFDKNQVVSIEYNP